MGSTIHVISGIPSPMPAEFYSISSVVTRKGRGVADASYYFIFTPLA